MRRFVLFFALAACTEPASYGVEVSWTTAGRSTTVPEDRVGVTILFPVNGMIEDEFIAGYEAMTVLEAITSDAFVDVCAKLESFEIVMGERLGIPYEERVFTAMTPVMCSRLQADADVSLHVDFAFAL